MKTSQDLQLNRLTAINHQSFTWNLVILSKQKANKVSETNVQQLK